MNRPGSRFTLTPYAPGEDCDCKANTYEWQFCPAHQLIEDERHLDVLIQHEVKSKLDWLEST